jgi:hypothetical protein
MNGWSEVFDEQQFRVFKNRKRVELSFIKALFGGFRGELIRRIIILIMSQIRVGNIPPKVK